MKVAKNKKRKARISSSKGRPSPMSENEFLKLRQRRASILKDPSHITKHLPQVFVNAVQAPPTPTLTSGNLSSALTGSRVTSGRTGSVRPRSNKRSYRCPKPCCRFPAVPDEDGDEYSQHTYKDISAAVVAVANRMRDSQRKRAEAVTRDELELIKHRVTMALHHYGIDTKINTDALALNDAIVFGVTAFDIEGERRKREERQKIKDLLSAFMSCLDTRQDLIRDLDFWFDNIDRNNLEIDDEVDTTEEVEFDMDGTFGYMNFTIKKMKTLIKKVFHGGVNESDDHAARLSDQDLLVESADGENVQKKLYNDLDLADPKQLKAAAKNVMASLEDLIKMTHGTSAKHCLRFSVKQLKSVWSALDKKSEDYLKLERQFQQRTAALNTAKKENEKFTEMRKKDKSRIQYLEEENEMLWERLNELQEEIDNRPQVMATDKPSQRERRVSIMLPSAEGKMAVANSMKAEKQDKVTEDNTKANIQDIQRRFSIQPPEDASNQRKSSIQENRRMSIMEQRRMSLAKNKRFSITSELILEEQSEVADANMPEIIEEEPSIEHVDNTVVTVLEETIDSLKTDLAECRAIIETQALKVSELEAELLGKDNMDDVIEELEKAKEKAEEELNEIKQKHMDAIDKKQAQINDLEKEYALRCNEISIKDDQIQAQQRCLDELSIDMQRLVEEKLILEEEAKNQVIKIETSGSGTSKPQLLVKVRNQYENELQRLRDHVSKEHQRFQADIRKVQMEHKKDVQCIHKESLQLLKAVNRFKDSIAKLLEKEALHEEAHEMRQLQPLPVDQFANNNAETRQMLARMAISATELLVSLETKLSKALLSKRLEIKENTTAKGFVLRDLEDQMDKLRKSKETGAIQNEKLKKYEERTMSLTDQYQTLLQEHILLQRELAPYRQLIDQHITLKKEFEKLQTEAKLAAKEKSTEIEDMEKDKEELRRAVEDQQTLITIMKAKQKLEDERKSKLRPAAAFYTSKEDQKANIKILEEAYEKDKITSETHEKTMSLIKMTMELPKLRFIHLVQRYVAHVRTKNLKEVMQQALVKYKNNMRMTRYVQQMEIRFQQRAISWEQRKHELVELRSKVFEQLVEAVTKVSNESGILLIKPLCKTLLPKGTSKKADWAADMLRSRDQPKPPLPDSISGKKLLAKIARPSFWKMSNSHSDDTLAELNIPTAMDLDVNQWQRAAKRLMAGDINNLPKSLIPNVKLAEIKRQHASRLTLPPIATLYPEED